MFVARLLACAVTAPLVLAVPAFAQSQPTDGSESRPHPRERLSLEVLV